MSLLTERERPSISSYKHVAPPEQKPSEGTQKNSGLMQNPIVAQELKPRKLQWAPQAERRRMKTLNRYLILVPIILASVQYAFGQKKPNIAILATGGTIAGAAATGTQAGYKSGAVTIDAMIAAVPGIKDMANIKGEQISNVGSQDMSFDIMLQLAKRINELMPQNDVDGFVITHGTDSWQLSLLTGSLPFLPTQNEP
jgi:asparaginase